MKFKRNTVDVKGLSPEMWFYLGQVDRLFQEELGEELIVTNAVAHRRYPSKHTKGFATDGRTRDHFNFTRAYHDDKFVRVIQRIRSEIDPMGFDTILEPDMLSEQNLRVRFSDARLKEMIGHADRNQISQEEFQLLRKHIPPHFHGEWDPKPGEVLAGMVD